VSEISGPVVSVSTDDTEASINPVPHVRELEAVTDPPSGFETTRLSVAVLVHVAVTLIWVALSHVHPSIVKWPPLSATVAP
jgi:hypothetical protein